MIRSGGLFATVFVLVACGSRADKGNDASKAAAESPAVVARRTASIRALGAAEYARTSAPIFDEALADHDVLVRRAAARGLSRIQDAHALELLGKGLSDEDDEVIAWSAYGLGVACPLGDTHTVRALVSRLTSLEGENEHGSQSSAVLSARAALFDALARCGSAPAEHTLRAWLAGSAELRSAAALSLGRLAARRHLLDDASVVALLDAANGSPPVHGALSAFGQLETISEVSAKRLVQVAGRALHEPGAERAFAIAAMLPAGAAGVDALGAALSGEELSPGERALVATTLARIGKPAQPALRAAVAAMVPKDAALGAEWLEGHFAPLEVALSALDPPAKEAADALEHLAELPVASDASPFVVHRAVALRCAAAAVLAGAASQAARLVHCDPDPKGHAGALAVLRVLDRGPLTGGRRRVWIEYARSGAPAARRAALALLPRHLEAIPVVDELVQALAANEPGVVAQAARALADAPRLAGTSQAPAATADARPAVEPSRPVVDALARAMDQERPADQIETRSALAGAAAAVGALSLKPRLERYCKSDNVTLRRSAESALRSLAASTDACAAPKNPPGVAPPTVTAGRETLTFTTDAGKLTLTLDPALAPLAVSKIVELARSKFYDGLPILRVTPGFLVQFGDSTGDGSGGAGKSPIPSEGAPVEFGPRSVGLALGGQDTGSSQIFVTETERPELFGDYPLLGKAGPGWANIVEGDRIVGVEIHDEQNVLR